MKSVRTAAVRAAVVPLVTLAILCGLVFVDPFRYLRELFVKTDQAHDAAKVSHFSDWRTQDVSNGQNPLASFRNLEPFWCEFHNAPRYILTGNSQTFTVLLAPSEFQIADTDRTYPDLLLDRVNAKETRAYGYRLSAPNISYMEVLWYLNYLLQHPCLTPTELIVQLNFDTFRKTGVRDGMLELLEDPAFARVIEQEAQSSAPYSGIFEQAVERYRSRVAKQTGNDAGAATTSKTGVTEARGLGAVIEMSVRTALDRFSAFKSRGEMKGELLDFLYLARVKLLGITPTTKRSLGGSTLKANVSSLERIGELCRKAGIRLVFFNAPQNPSAPLYRTTSDAEQYRHLVSRLAGDYAEKYYDFEDSIPDPMWGVWVDGPDPIHFGRAAHHRLAELMFEQNVIGGNE